MKSQADREILASLLVYGDNATGNIADIADRHPNTVRNSLDKLQSEGLIHAKGAGVYCLTFPGVVAARAVIRETSIDLEEKQDLIEMIAHPDLVSDSSDSSEIDG